MAEVRGAIHCPQCGSTDFHVVSTEVVFRGGTIVETYRWPPEAPLEDTLGIDDGAYEVTTETILDPEIVGVEGKMRALCSVCLADVTDLYLAHGRESLLPA
jgi:hypothetical protein